MPRRIPHYRPASTGSRANRCASRHYEGSGRRRADKAWYKSPAWVRLRDQVRAEEPLCRLCLASGTLEPTRIVDHILPRRTRPDLALARSNLRGLCVACNNRVRREQAGNDTERSEG